MFTDCFSIPKIELHAHLNGCIRAETFLELAEKKNVNIEHLDFYHVDVKMAFEIFKVGAKLITDLHLVKRITKEMIEDYKKHNTVYLEIRSSPKEFEGTTKLDYISKIIHKSFIVYHIKICGITLQYRCSN